jgi:DNA helicase-2/ATP-dependent DNA helicase PcrA
MNLEAEKTVLPQSYRIPKKVHTIAENIIEKVKKREPKIYRPTSHSGEVIQVENLNNIPLDDVGMGSWLLLTRNRAFIESYDLACYQKYVRYTTVGNDEALSLGTAIRIWKKLERNECILGSEAKLLYGFLKTRDRIKHGYKKVVEATLEDDREVDIEDLQTEFGLLYKGAWKGAFFHRSDFELNYYEKVDKFYGLDNDCLVRISTIHSAKGDEADNVVLMPDMTPRTYEGYQEDPDNEHRVFYVGVTRAKERLFICQPMGNRYYEL